MYTTWFNLAWKEWHEHKWKLVAIVATLWSVAALMMRGMSHEVPSADVLVAVRVVLVMCIVPLAIFVGLGTAAGERSHGHTPLPQSLPVPMWRVAFSKVLFGVATIVAAVLLTLGFVYVWCKVAGADFSVMSYSQPDEPFSFGMHNWFNNTTTAILCVAISFYIWTVACGVNRRDEVSAGAVALFIMAIWTAIVLYGVHWLDRSTKLTPEILHGTGLRLVTVALSTIPGGLLSIMQMTSPGGPWNSEKVLHGLGIFTASMTYLTMIAWYVERFGRTTNLEVRSQQPAKRTANQIDWLGPPRRSPLTAVAWKQLREAGPIAVAGLAGIIGLVALTELTGSWEGSKTPDIGSVYNVIALGIGFVIALMIGLGICFYDVQPKLAAFCGSRPIHPDLWFWCKYIMGLIVLSAAIYLPILLIATLDDKPDVRNSDFPHAFVYPVAHVAVFASAVAMLCLVRHAIYAAILSIGFLYLGVLLAYSAWYLSALVGWTEPNPDIWWQPTLAQGTSGLITSIVVSTLLAWLATRYDWGKKSRY